MVAQIYICSEHGETIHPIKHEVYVVWMCPDCTREVEALTDEGKPVMRPLTNDEMYWESFEGDF